MGFTIRGQMVPNTILTDLTLVDPATRVLINGGAWSTWLHQDGSFAVDVPPGEWLLEVESKDFVFPKFQLVVDTDAQNRERVTAMPVAPGQRWAPGSNHNAQGKVVKHPLSFSAFAQMEFFTPREQFNFVGMFTSPYILMTLFTVAIMFIMPKLQANMDPESLKDWEDEKSKMQKQMDTFQAPDFSASLANWMSAGGPQGAGASSSSPLSSKKKRR
ncbi:hypothetical protein H4R34_003272 [Dimargaris verticillata]|uniref:ER membrane protein complex subunit 7 beta-sandwich domain-containing protein n=1 Tax=Dimargaris verticillata TaxID=2761393 RepID=A0A9W8EDB0_9FUNG|nr:hypothetical protein H4R34_003272 [Dimargaris verticillata]